MDSLLKIIEEVDALMARVESASRQMQRSVSDSRRIIEESYRVIDEFDWRIVHARYWERSVEHFNGGHPTHPPLAANYLTKANCCENIGS